VGKGHAHALGLLLYRHANRLVDLASDVLDVVGINSERPTKVEAATELRDDARSSFELLLVVLHADELEGQLRETVFQVGVQVNVGEVPERTSLLLGNIVLTQNQSSIAELSVDLIDKLGNIGHGLVVDLLQPVLVLLQHVALANYRRVHAHHVAVHVVRWLLHSLALDAKVLTLRRQHDLDQTGVVAEPRVIAQEVQIAF